ncbi:putative ribonuclease H-like domain-containing protein [Tanacetum coccineum]|uniref:Ribonuclease H-like domain-containing protein n=1 Tax=Tanacetum coccineum TaxID=301880 RepID=A0ABQ5HG71_9ASTR
MGTQSIVMHLEYSTVELGELNHNELNDQLLPRIGSNGNASYKKHCNDEGKIVWRRTWQRLHSASLFGSPLFKPFLSKFKGVFPDARFKPLGDDKKKVTKEPEKEGGDPSKEDERDDQEKDVNVNSTNTVNAASTNKVNAVGGKIGIDLPNDLNMPELEDIVYSDNDEDVGAEVDMNKFGLPFRNVSPILTHKNTTNDLHSVQQRTNHKDFQNCLFACFLSQEEPKKVIHALKNPSWIEAMQEELLQFKLQEVWILVDLPNRKRVIGTKWVFMNKKDERGIVIKNKARLVAQGYTQEEGIDYDEYLPLLQEFEALGIFCFCLPHLKDFMDVTTRSQEIPIQPQLFHTSVVKKDSYGT